MDLEALGNIGEMIGGVAVVISLVYLARQMRQNTMTVRSSTYQSIVAAAAACNVTLSQSKELARLMRLGSDDPSQLDEDERVQFSFLCTQFFDIFENLYLQREHGILDDDFWLPRAAAYLGLFQTPGFAHFWAERSDGYATSFKEYVDGQLAALPDQETRRRLFLSDDPS